MHICLISQEYPPDTGWGGIGSYTYEMAHGLAKHGHKVTVISRAITQEKIVENGNVQVHRILPSPDWEATKGMWWANRVWPGFAWSAWKRVQVLHREAPIHVIETCEGRADGFFVGLQRQLNQSWPKLIIRLHTARIFIDHFNRSPVGLRKRYDYWLEKQSIRWATVITAPSQAIVDLTRTWQSLPADSTFIIPNPVDTSAFHPGTTNRRHEVLFVGRLERNKGVETLLEVIPQLADAFPSLCFRVVGSDGMDATGRSWRDQLMASLPKTRQDQLILEHVSRTTLVERYQQAMLLLLPSLWENCPYTALEAMACATPVVATRVGGVPEIIADGVTGLLVPPDSADCLVEKAGELLENEPRRREIGRNARLHIEQSFGSTQIIPKMIAFYQSIIES